MWRNWEKKISYSVFMSCGTFLNLSRLFFYSWVQLLLHELVHKLPLGVDLLNDFLGTSFRSTELVSTPTLPPIITLHNATANPNYSSTLGSWKKIPRDLWRVCFFLLLWVVFTSGELLLSPFWTVSVLHKQAWKSSVFIYRI